jgi:hypothetical protein
MATSKLPYKRWIYSNNEFLQEVKEEGPIDEEYLEALQSLGKEDKNTDITLYLARRGAI